MCRSTAARVSVLWPALALATLGSGCYPEAGLPKDASPVVQPDSEAARKALAERDQMIRERQQQEARARQRHRGLPDEG
jgi:hypothetical protein